MTGPDTATPETERLMADARAFAERRAKIMADYRASIDDSKTWASALYAADIPVLTIAEIFGVNRQQVYKWLGMKPPAK